MSEDRTAPMQEPQWSRREVQPDDEATLMAGQDSPTPPTLPAAAPDRRPWEQPAPPPGFVRTTPPGSPTPPPYQQPQAPYGAPAGQRPQAPIDQTMMIGEQKPGPVFAWLVVVDGPDKGSIGKVHTLHPDSSSIGRAQANQIPLRDETCSAQHARIRVESQEGGDPVFVLYDMGSRNGTFVGDKRTYKDETTRKYRQPLQDGDYILIGETTLVFKKI